MTLPWGPDEAPVPGVYSGIPAEAYHAAPGVSASRLKLFEHCPWQARFGARRETEAMALGTLLHAMFLEPDTIQDRYWVARAKRGTKAWEAEEARAMGRQMLTEPEWQEAVAIFDAVHAQPVTRRLLGGPHETEVSFWWIDPPTGLLCKGRCDVLRRDIGVMVDLKKCQDASMNGFRRSMEVYSYDYQSLHYQDGFALAPGGFKLDDFIFLAFEEPPPHMAAAWRHDLDQQDDARTRVRSLLDQWAECEDSGEWPGYPQVETDLSLSHWRYRNR